MKNDDRTETIAFQLRLRPGCIEAYRRRHDALWPEMRDALRAAGVIDYEIWFEPGSTRLFAWMRRRRDHGLAQLREQAVWQRWQAHMADLLEQDAAGPARLDLACVFRLPEVEQKP